jgi:aryl-alcohol dehydrogenase-like predicted oxidoreductase
VDYIDLYYQHRIDTTVPIGVTVRRNQLENFQL